MEAMESIKYCGYQIAKKINEHLVVGSFVPLGDEPEKNPWNKVEKLSRFHLQNPPASSECVFLHIRTPVLEVVFRLQSSPHTPPNLCIHRLTTTNFSITVTKYLMGFEDKTFNYQLLFMLLHTYTFNPPLHDIITDMEKRESVGNADNGVTDYKQKRGIS
ncbi:hypothetical protein E5288_WYG017243 [Bos mutus]|uniref:Uncharacterized protein n=1 Tax=Bos mutus TaxID=72004 RepID=A0A6B0S1S3_9CETA|nr:hypothetical protein [Bos mutus]